MPGRKWVGHLQFYTVYTHTGPSFLNTQLPPHRLGLRRPTTQIADWMAVAKQALTRKSDKFTFIITPKKKPDVLRVRWEYQAELSDFEGRLAGQIDVEHAQESAAVTQSILSTVFDNLSSLQESQQQVQHQCDMFRREAESAQQQVQDYVEQKHKREAELYVKFAAVLNEKKAKAVEWKLKAEQAQAAVQKASTEGIAAEGTPPRDTYSQSTDPSDDEHVVGQDPYDAARSGSQANSSRNRSQDEPAETVQQATDAQQSPGSTAQAAQGPDRLQLQPSVTLDKEYDPGDDPEMQEGDLMDVDTVPIAAEALNQKPTQASSKATKRMEPSPNPPNATAASRPARPKAVTRRRR